MTVKFLDLVQQYASIKGEVDAAIADVLSGGVFIGGAAVTEFEKLFAEYQSAGHCVAVGNGTDALEIALEALDLPPGSEVIVPANSFIATGEAVTRAGHRVVFADIDPETYLIDVQDAEKRMTSATGAIICVHLYGRPCDMDALRDLARRHGVRLVEDAAQAHGAEWRGRRVGAIGDVGTFSFYPGKNLGAYGDGGAIVTGDQALATRCRMIANHGRISKYDHEFEGRNSRLDGLQAAVLRVKLGHLDDWTRRRNEVADRYRKSLDGVGDLVLPAAPDQLLHSFHLFVVRTSRRVSLMKHLAAAGIQTGQHYPISLPKLVAYAYLGPADPQMRANQLDGQLLSLPIGEHLNDDDVDEVVTSVRGFFSA